MTQEEMKKLVGQAALAYVQPDTIIGVGTGSTVNHFIDALASIKDQIKAAVSSSEASTARLQALGIHVMDLNEVTEFDIYVDGADDRITSYNVCYTKLLRMRLQNHGSSGHLSRKWR